MHDNLIPSRSQQPELTAPTCRGSGLRGAAPVGGERAERRRYVGSAVRSRARPAENAVSQRPLAAERVSVVWWRPLAARRGVVPPLPAAPEARGFPRCTFFALLLPFSFRKKQEDGQLIPRPDKRKYVDSVYNSFNKVAHKAGHWD